MKTKWWNKRWTKNMLEKLKKKFSEKLRKSGKMIVVSRTFSKEDKTISIERTWDSKGFMAKRMTLNGMAGQWCPIFDKPLPKNADEKQKRLILESDLESETKKLLECGWIWMKEKQNDAIAEDG